jgi:hypothetical protein
LDNYSLFVGNTMNRSFAGRRSQQPFRGGIGVLAILVLSLNATSIVAIASASDENAANQPPAQPRSRWR